MSGTDQLFNYVRRALNHLYDPEYLAKSPLLALLDADTHREPALALQAALIKAIESMRPRAGGLLAGRDQQAFDLLLYRYVQRLTQEEIAHQLGISERQLRRDQNRAIQLLVEWLWQRYELDQRSSLLAKPSHEGRALSSGGGHESFAWLVQEGQDALTDPNQALVTVVELAEQLAKHYGMQLAWSGPPDLPPLAIHPVAFRQILVILVAHAVQTGLGGEGSTVVLEVSQAANQVVFAIVAPSGSASGAPDDAGIGQAQELIALFGGSLVVEPKERSLSLRLSLPVFEQQTVLVIDDNADFVQLLSRYASGTRYRIVGVQESEQAFSLLESVIPRIILLDVMMPRTDGWEMLKRLRAHPLAARQPIVICTILKQPELAFALGATAFLNKPVNQADFLATLARFSAPQETAAH